MLRITFTLALIKDTHKQNIIFI